MIMSRHSVHRPLPAHGGSFTQVEHLFPCAQEEWIDLSTGINPWPYPIPQLSETVWRRLPDDRDMQALYTAARLYYQLPKHAHLVASAGSQTLIQVLPSLMKPTSCAIASPTYSEHALCWQRACHRVHTMDITENSLLKTQCPVVIVTNPNNPTGHRIKKHVLHSIRDRIARQNGLLIVDEAFSDGDPEVSIAKEGGTQGLIILRSFGKFFGLAGLRLGFAITTAKIASKLTQILGPWPISGPAIAIGTQAYQDTTWITQTRKKLSFAAQAFDRFLQHYNINIIGGTSLFRLIHMHKASEFFERCCRRGILLRCFTDHPLWLRIALPQNSSVQQRLRDVLKDMQRL